MFISNFVKWNSGSECPGDYLLWTAYGVLSMAIGPRVWFDAKQFFITPQIYVLLTGPSGNRKTFARDKGEDILKAAFPDAVMSAECESHQGILRYMDNPEQERSFIDPLGKEVKFHPYGLFAPELMDYLCINPINFVNFLTNIYDRKVYTYRLAGSERMIINPYFVMMSCTTDDWFTQQLNARTFGHGYGRRTIIVFAEKFERKIIFYNKEHEAARLACIEHLKQLPNVIGEMIPEPGVMEFFNHWYISQTDVDDSFLSAWQSTKHINIWKVAVLTSLAERLDRVITFKHLELAMNLIENVEERLPFITDRMGRSELIEPINAVLAYLKQRNGYVPSRELQAKMLKHFKTTLEYFNVTRHLLETNQIVKGTFNINNISTEYISLPQCVHVLHKLQNKEQNNEDTSPPDTNPPGVS